MKKLFTTISNRLKEQIPELWVDADYGQADNFELRPALKFPCALLTVSINPEEVGGGAQSKTAAVQVRFVFNLAGVRTAADAPPEARENSLKYLDIADRGYLALQGWETDDFTAMECTSIAQENRSDGLLAVRFALTTTFYDFRPADQ